MLQFSSTGMILFGLNIHWYGVIIATGMALAVGLAARRERRLKNTRVCAACTNGTEVICKHGNGFLHLLFIGDKLFSHNVLLFLGELEL